MIRFLFSALIGAAIAVGCGWLWIERAPDCLRRCGDGTACFSGHCIPRGAPTTVASDAARARPAARRAPR
jgi:hypothetical protein